MPDPNYISENELNIIKGLVHYLNAAVGAPGDAMIGFDVNAIDCNGEPCGSIEFEPMGETYVFKFPR